VDLGAGDGAYVAATAAACPDVLVIGVDAHGPAMAPAGRRIERQRLANALLVAARAEDLPAELDGLAAAVRIHFPWGSLLRGVIEGDEDVASGLARITRPGGTVTALLSVTDRERGLGLPRPDHSLAGRLSAAYAPHGLALAEWRPADPGDVAEARSSWAKRLGGGRETWLLRLENGRPRGSSPRPRYVAPARRH
jgi:16S rRNA (adenine(1408)-N(1))-methyltransferase